MSLSAAGPGSAAALYRTHLVADVLGFWLAEAPDDACGGVFTCWDNAGTTLVSTDKYTWSQGRWIWLLARCADAARRGLLPLDADTCLARAEATARFVRDHALLPDATTAFVTAADGTPREPTPGGGLHTSVFADLFVAIGYAALARAAGDAAWADQAEELLASAARRIAAGAARTEPYPVPPGFAAFSLPMILTGAGTEVYRATRSPAAAQVVIDAASAMAERFATGPDGHDITEMAPTSAADADTVLARHRAPGHVLEAVWFLADAADTVPGCDVDPDWLTGVALHALRLGWDDEHGGLLRYTDRDGGAPTGRRIDDRYEQLVLDTWDTKLWWPHAEALYTCALLGRQTGNAELLTWHRRLHDYTFATFPAGPGREWVQIRNRDGSPLDAVVALPVKDPFHIARSLLLLVELLDGRSQRLSGNRWSSCGEAVLSDAQGRAGKADDPSHTGSVVWRGAPNAASVGLSPAQPISGFPTASQPGSHETDTTEGEAR